MSDDLRAETNSVDIEEIMIEIKKQALQMPEISFAGIDEVMFELYADDSPETSSNERLRSMSKHSNVTVYPKVAGNPLIKFIKKVIRKLTFWTISPSFAKQTKLNQDNVNELFAINNELKTKAKYLENLENRICHIEELMNNQFSIIESKIDQSTTSINHRIDLLEEKIFQDVMESPEMKKFEKTIHVINYRLWRAEKKANNNEEILSSTESIRLQEDNLNTLEGVDMDYFLFEEYFRGDEKSIHEAISIYLPYFSGKQNVLDVGCGRGEFLKLLAANNISAKGIDLDDDMVQYCEKDGLEVSKEDVLSFLSDVENNSLGGIISTQVVEHLEINYMIEFIRSSFKKLEAGAYFIAETINPQSLIVFTESYFMDPSHVKMIHPLTIKFLLESEGFSDVEIIYSSEVADNMKLPYLKSLFDEEQNKANSSIDILNGLVYGNRNYAVVGRK